MCLIGFTKYMGVYKMSKVKKFFDEFSDHYDEFAFHSSVGTLFLSLIEESFILGNSLVSNNTKVLDIGLGTGRCSNLLAKQGAKIYGLDISNNMMKYAKKKLGKSLVEFKRLDVQKGIPYPDNYFDIIMNIRVLKYMSKWRFVIKEINRALKPGGILLLELSNKFSISSLGTKGTHYFLFDIKEVIKELEKNGFLIKNIEGGAKLPFTLYKNVNNYLLLNFLKNIEKILQIFLSFYLSRNILIVAKKVRK